MRKSDAIELLGGSISSAARAIGCTRQAVWDWPDELSPRVADRVHAAVLRLAMRATHHQPSPNEGGKNRTRRDQED